MNVQLRSNDWFNSCGMWIFGYFFAISFPIAFLVRAAYGPYYEWGGTAFLALIGLLAIAIGVCIFHRQSPIWSIPSPYAAIVGLILFLASVGVTWIIAFLVWFGCVLVYKA